MSLILAGFAGVITALFVHWLTWYTRLNHLSFTVNAGMLAALFLTLFLSIYLTSDLPSLFLNLLIILWAFALGIGYLQARSLPAPWWKGVMGIFYELALAFLIGASVNLTLQRYIGELDNRFPGIPVYPIISSFIRGLAILLLILSVLRPLIRLYRSRAGSSKAN